MQFRLYCPPNAVLPLSALLIGCAVDKAAATDPESICQPHDVLIGMLAGRPHYERQALALKDEIPSQRHSIELFMNSGEDGRHTYSLVRTRRGEKVTCLISAGLVAERRRDKHGHRHLILEDENDPDTFDFVTCDGRYVMLRRGAKMKIGRNVDICADVKLLAHTPRVVVSYGQIKEDHRSEIPWPAH